MAKRYKEYVFVQYRRVDVIHPMHGKIDTARNYELSSEMFECLAKTATHILIKNANPYRQIFQKPEIMPLEILEVTIAPGQFVMAYLKEIELLRKEITAFQANRQRGAPAIPVIMGGNVLPENHPLARMMRQMMERKNKDEPPSEAPGSTADLPPGTPPPAGSPHKF